ncbi:MAG: DUF2283 domain-containing protein [Armatimonadetes bacterium]|nr:DUF2283 domain-containing protein [Armatimonadota bacterium]
MGGYRPSLIVDYDDLADVLYLRLHQPQHTIGEINDEGIIFVMDDETDELVGVDILDFWERFVRQDGTLDDEALRRCLVAPFSEMIDEIRRGLLPA